jgi:hypothetical protein
METIAALGVAWANLSAWVKVVAIVLVVLVVLSTILTALVGVLERRQVRVPVWLVVVADLLALVPRPGKWGIVLGYLNLPGVPSFGQRKDPPSGGAAVALLVVGALALSACHMSDYARADIAITAQTKVANAATEAVTAWDETNQAQIVADARTAGTTADARAEIAKDQRTLKLARATIRTFGAAIQAEAVGVELARQAKAKLDLGALLPRLLRLGRDLVKSLRDFGVTVPNIPLLGGA